MGRKTIGEAVLVRLPGDMLARIDALAPRGKRADFIRAAVEAELERREALTARAMADDPAALYQALSLRRQRKI